MNKNIFILFFAICFAFVSVSASPLIDSEWIEYTEEGSRNLGYSLNVMKGETASFFIWMTSHDDVMGYRVFMDDNNPETQATDIIPHTVMQGEECQGNTTFCDHFEYIDLDTSELEGSYKIFVSVNEDGDLNDYEKTAELYLTVSEQEINQYPERPFNPEPAHNQENIPISTYLSWSAVDPDGDDLTYTIYFGTDSNHLIKVAEDLENEQYLINDLDYGTKYYWKIVADDGELQTESYVWKFKTTKNTEPVNHAPNQARNPNPENGAINIDLNPLLSWIGTDPDGDDLNYHIYFGTSPVMNSLLYWIGKSSNQEYQLSDLEYDTTYYWMIISYDGQELVAGPTWSFTTKSQTTNNAPVIEEINNQRAKCGKEFNLQVNAIDQDNDELTYEDNSELFDINPETGLISFTPSCKDKGTYDIEITVTDEHGEKDTEEFELKIYRASSGGGGKSSSKDDEELPETEVIVKKGICINDFDGDNEGIRTVTYKTVDLETRQLYSYEIEEEICLLYEEKEEQKTTEYKGNSGMILLVALIFLLITIPIAIYAYKKLS